MILPRLAVGTIQPEADATCLTWALLRAFETIGCRVQDFRSQSTFVPCDGVLPITGREQRHLDSWVMNRATCERLIQWNMRDADLALIEGPYDAAHRSAADQPETPRRGGSLDQLCEWLDVPRLLVVDVDRLHPCDLRPPPFPVRGILLDRFGSDDEYAYWATLLETVWGAPVWGGLPRVDQLRAHLARPPVGERPEPDVLHQLGAALGSRSSLDAMLDAATRSMPGSYPLEGPCASQGLAGLRVAVAFDEAFHCYFPDVLDALEAMGAELHMFSPLRSATLPDRTDLLYLGCGRIDRFADELAANHCLKQEIHRFVALGGRVYAECSGLAYLCRQVVVAGRRYAMIGALPALASLGTGQAHPYPVNVTLNDHTWLARAGQELRGYANPLWHVSPWGGLRDLAAGHPQGELFAYRNVIASRMHINFAAHPRSLQHLVHPLRGSKSST